MIKRSLLAVLSIVIMMWIGFVSYDLLHQENTSNFRSYFQESDGAVWAIHQPYEVNWDDHSIQTIALNQSL